MNNKLLLNEWFYVNELTVNVQKTDLLTFGSYCDSVPDNINILLNGSLISRKQSIKYLGILLDYNLKWEMHINKLVNKCRYFLSIFRKLSYLPTKVLEIMQYGYIYSILNYGITIWGGAYPTALKRLNSIQDKFIKFLKSDEIPSIAMLYRTKCIMFHYSRLSKQFVSSKSITRNKSLQIPRYNKNISQKNSLYSAVFYFNKLPSHLKALTVTDKIMQYLKNNL